MNNIQPFSNRITEKILQITSYVIIFLAIAVRLAVYFHDRPFWIDEAGLASSVIQRSYPGLFQTLEYSQGAPVGYLCLVKTLVFLFGPSEYVLRLPSLASGISSIYLFYLILKIVLKDPRPYVGTAFFSLVHFLIYYSTEFKPYMLDAFWTLVTLLLFHFVKIRRVPDWMLLPYCAIVIWLSFPVIFTLATLCIVWLFQAFGQNKEDISRIIRIGSASIISFVIFYFLVYPNISDNQQLGFWAAEKIPFFPHSPKDFFLLILALHVYLGTFGTLIGLLVVFLTIVGFFHSSLRRNALTGIFIVETLLIITVSALGYYYVEIRLMLFFVPIHILFVSMTLSYLAEKYKKVGPYLLFSFILMNIGSCRYFWVLDDYRPQDDIRPLIECFEKSGKSDPLYLYCDAIPLYEYKTHYETRITCKKNGVIYGAPYGDFPFQNENFKSKIVEKNGVIFGTEYFTYTWDESYGWNVVIQSASLDENVAAILRNKRTYLLFAESAKKNMETAYPLLDALKQHGTIRRIMAKSDAALLLFELK